MTEILILCFDCNQTSMIDTSNLVNPPYTTCGKCGSVNAHKVEVERHLYGTPRIENI